MTSKHLELPAAPLHRLVFPWWIHDYYIKLAPICMRSRGREDAQVKLSLSISIFFVLTVH